MVVGLSKPGDAAAINYQKDSLKLAVAQLAAHGVEAKAEQLALSEIGLMDALLNRAADYGADLLALGAFGGGGYPLFSRGSGSRYMLKHMTLPIFSRTKVRQCWPERISTRLGSGWQRRQTKKGPAQTGPFILFTDAISGRRGRGGGR